MVIIWHWMASGWLDWIEDVFTKLSLIFSLICYIYICPVIWNKYKKIRLDIYLRLKSLLTVYSMTLYWLQTQIHDMSENKIWDTKWILTSRILNHLFSASKYFAYFIKNLSLSFPAFIVKHPRNVDDCTER